MSVKNDIIETVPLFTLGSFGNNPSGIGSLHKLQEDERAVKIIVQRFQKSCTTHLYPQTIEFL